MGHRTHYESAMNAYQYFKATGKVMEASSLDMDRVEQVEKENAELKKQLATILKRLDEIEGRMGGNAAPKKEAKEDKKGKLIAKSNIIWDVKPWDDETDMVKLEESIRSITMDGLLWGTGKLVAVGYGIKKLQITCVIEDDKVSTDDMEESMTGFDDYVQSVDIVAFNKI